MIKSHTPLERTGTCAGHRRDGAGIGADLVLGHHHDRGHDRRERSGRIDRPAVDSGTVAGTSGDGGSPGTQVPVAAAKSKGCGAGAAVPVGPSEHTLRSDEVERKYLVIIPRRHGSDRQVRGGGSLNGTTISNQNFRKGQPPAGMPEQHSVDSSMKAWAKHNKCDPEPVEGRISPEVRRRTWQHCEADTILYIVDNGGHAWPGKPQPSFEKSFGHGTKDIDASKLLFDFFFTHPNP